MYFRMILLLPHEDNCKDEVHTETVALIYPRGFNGLLRTRRRSVGLGMTEGRADRLSIEAIEQAQNFSDIGASPANDRDTAL